MLLVARATPILWELSKDISPSLKIYWLVNTYNVCLKNLLGTGQDLKSISAFSNFLSSHNIDSCLEQAPSKTPRWQKARMRSLTDLYLRFWHEEIILNIENIVINWFAVLLYTIPISANISKDRSCIQWQNVIVNNFHQRNTIVSTNCHLERFETICDLYIF